MLYDQIDNMDYSIHTIIFIRLHIVFFYLLFVVLSVG